MRPPLWVPAIVLVGVLGFVAATIVRAMKDRPEHLPSMLYPWSEPDMNWTSWEHAGYLAGVGSFVVSMLALIAAVVAGWIAWQQLHHQIEEIQQDQRRIADELQRRPKLVLGFPLKDDPEVRDRKFSRRYQPSQPATTPYKRLFTLNVFNDGERTAHNVVVDVWMAPGGVLGSMHMQARGLFSGGLRLQTIEMIHPKREEQLSFEVSLPHSLVSHDIELRVVTSFNDYPPESEMLLVGIGFEGEDDETPWPRCTLTSG